MRYRLASLALAARLLAPAPGRAQDSSALADSLIRARLTTPELPYVAMRDSARPFDATSYFNIAVRSAGLREYGAAMFACVVELEARPPAATCIPVPMPGVDPDIRARWLDAPRLEIGDLDADGEPEARIDVDYYGPLPRGFSGGETDEYTRFYVFDATPAPHLAANLLVRHSSVNRRVTTVQGEVELRDVNGDGHADVVLTGETCAGNPRTGAHDRCTPLGRQLLWNRRTDGWSQGGAARP